MLLIARRTFKYNGKLYVRKQKFEMKSPLSDQILHFLKHGIVWLVDSKDKKHVYASKRKQDEAVTNEESLKAAENKKVAGKQDGKK